MAALLSLIVWFSVPQEYTALTKVSDEYREVDLAVGLNMLKAQLKAAAGGDNVGMNDMAVYSRLLDSEDFARKLSHVRVEGTGRTYGQYLGRRDTVRAVQKRLAYNYSDIRATLTIGVTDRDAIVASQLLDSVTSILQQEVTDYRHSVAQAALQNMQQQANRLRKEHDKAKQAYIDFIDSHLQLSTQAARQQERYLAQESTKSYQRYEDAVEQSVRQRALVERSYMSFATVQPNSVPLTDNRSPLLYFFALLTLFLLLARGYELYTSRSWQGWVPDLGDFFSPWVLTVFIWVANIALYFIQGTLDPIGPQFVQCLTVWLATLLPASLLAYWLTQDAATPLAGDYRVELSVPLSVFRALYVVAGLLTLLYASRIWGIVSQFDMDNLLYNLRLYIVEDNSVTGLLNHVQGLNFALFAVGIWIYPKISKWELFYIVMVNLVFEIFRMEKSGILIMILGTMFLLYERKTIKMHTILLTFAGIIVFFFFFNLSKEEADSEQDTTFLDFFAMYVTSPLVAFEHLRPDISGHFGENTFCIIYPYLNMLGLHLDYVDRLQEFVWVPIPTNVYTVMQPFYNDFGVPGIGFFGIVYGVLFGWTYRKFREGSPLFICIYTYLVQVILIQFYNDNLLQNIVLFLEFCFFVALFTQRQIKLQLAKA